MAKIIVSENVTLDGVVQDPTGDEGFEGGGWFGRVTAADREAFGAAALEEALAAEAFLMGRRTYEFLASRWPARTGALAERLNALPKYVVSATLGQAAWHNTTVLGADAAEAATELSRRVDGDIVVPASFQLVRSLFAHDLVDQIRVLVYPVVLGTGARLFAGLPAATSLHLLDSRVLGDHLTRTTYEVVRAPQE